MSIKQSKDINANAENKFSNLTCSNQDLYLQTKHDLVNVYSLKDGRSTKGEIGRER